MLRVVIGFLVLALIVALFGFEGVANYSWPGAKILFFVFLAVAALSLLGHVMYRRRYSRE